ncbi:hypothetical protein A2U01_0058211, partial [Trifolium medium]|nr:hypothetical protein [Trifolium medium]
MTASLNNVSQPHVVAVEGLAATLCRYSALLTTYNT